MAPRKKASREQILKEKRERERARYQRIKEDPVLRAAQAEKEREKYRKKKEQGKVKPVNKMSAREKRIKRKNWRKNSDVYYKKKKAIQKGSSFIVTNSPPETPQHEPEIYQEHQPINPVPIAQQARSGRKRIRRDRSKLVRENFKLRELVAQQKTQIERLRKRVQRSTSQTTPNTILSPNKRVGAFLKSNPCKNQIRRRLLIAECLEEGLNSAYRQLNSHKKKQLFRTMFSQEGLKNLKKYRLFSSLNFVNENIFKTRVNPPTESSATVRLSRRLKCIVKNEVTQFFESDDVSKMCPGKKDFVVLKKVKKQKRLLLDTMKNLHQKFNSNHPYNLSYSLFCTLRPFWVRIPTVGDRETCACLRHTNMDLIVRALHQANILSERTPTEVLKSVCCDSLNVKCLHNKCTTCSEALPLYMVFDGSEKVNYEQWLRTTHSYLDKRKNIKHCKKVQKVRLEAPALKLVQKFERELALFTFHVGNIRHQHQAISQLKLKLETGEFIIHMDFSENYNTKYNTEIQSFHFGGSRGQVSVHTVVVYYRSNDFVPVQTKSICTLSENLDHTPPAIWAHLQPVLDVVKSLATKVKKVHFLSDGPTSQYRNKDFFFMISRGLTAHFPSIEVITGNYSESGHGKGAPDGLGGCLKRTADRLVAQGIDIPNLKTMVSELTTCLRNVSLFVIESSDIEQARTLIPKNLEPFKGTLKVHQFIAQPKKSSDVCFKSLSCFDCFNCATNTIGKISYDLSTLPNDPDGAQEPAAAFLSLELEEVLDESRDESQREEETEGHGTCQSSSEMIHPPSPLHEQILEEGDYLLIRFITKKKVVFYVGRIVVGLKSDGLTYEVSYLRKKGNYFVYPDVPDQSTIRISDVVSKLPFPTLSRGRVYFETDFSQFNIR